MTVGSERADQFFILCQGEQRRLAHLGMPKQLLDVAGEPILVRTIRLVREHVHPRPQITVVGSHPELDLGDRLLTIDPGNCILDGIAALRSEWRGPQARTVMLLGDVVWSRDALFRLCDDRRELVFAVTRDLTTSTGEVYGFSFDPQRQDEIGRLLEIAPCRGATSQNQVGHLRKLVRLVEIHRRLTGPVTGGTVHRDLAHFVDDWTSDIDTQADSLRLPALAEYVHREECALGRRGFATGCAPRHGGHSNYE